MGQAGPVASHVGAARAVQRVRRRLWWPGLRRDVGRCCRSCTPCQLGGRLRHVPPPAPLQPLPVIATPFTHAMVDGVGPLPETGRGIEYLLTVLDMVRAYRVRFPTEWDVAMPFLMFATRDSVCESTGVTPFQLGYGHEIRGPLQMLKERVTRPPVRHEPLEYVARFTDRLQAACE